MNWIDRQDPNKSINYYLKLLTNLTSIRILYSPLCQTMKLTIIYTMILKEFFKNTQIKKVTLRNVTEWDHITYIFEHFHSIEYFGLEQVRSTDLKSMIRSLLQMAKTNSLRQLMTICVILLMRNLIV